MEFNVKPFAELSLRELYRILEIRVEVFVVEQDCVYQDIDGKDTASHHVIGIVDKEIHAYTRILPPGTSYDNYASIGRVLTTKEVRRDGYGRKLMKASIEACEKMYPTHKIKISAQTYLLKFYNGLGFVQEGEDYLEDGIPHVGMVYKR